MSCLVSLIAQATPTTRPSGQPSPAAPFFLPGMMLALLAFMLLSARSQKKREKRERDDMHARLSKNDRVLTIGGAIGTVVSVRDNEVVVKVDESTNTKMTFLKTSIQRILSDEVDSTASKK
ncbi:MAG: preprotein translocase subunit YajC [Phycisphaerae bacterium]